MIERDATIESIGRATAYISLRAPGSCPRCAVGKGCGGGILRPWRPESELLIQFDCERLPAGAVVGDRVSVRIPERVFLRMAVLAYALPILLFAATALALDQLTDLAELWVALGAAFALLASYRLSNRLVKRRAKAFTPEVVKCPVP